MKVELEENSLLVIRPETEFEKVWFYENFDQDEETTVNNHGDRIVVRSNKPKKKEEIE